MRQLWAQGWVQQKVRMVTASFLIEFLRMDWKHGHKWYIDTLLDHDIAINTMMWQNAGRSGVDQWDFVMSPMDGAGRDPQGKYCLEWCPEVKGLLPGKLSQSDRIGKSKEVRQEMMDPFFNPSGNHSLPGDLKLVALDGK